MKIDTLITTLLMAIAQMDVSAISTITTEITAYVGELEAKIRELEDDVHI